MLSIVLLDAKRVPMPKGSFETSVLKYEIEHFSYVLIENLIFLARNLLIIIEIIAMH